MDLGTAFRSYIERRSFLGDHSDTQFIEGEQDRKWIPRQLKINFFHRWLYNIAHNWYVLPPEGDRIGALYSLHTLQTVSLKLFLLLDWEYNNFHHRVVSMGGCSLALTMVFYATEALYFRSSTLNFYVIFPCVLNSEYPVL